MDSSHILIVDDEEAIRDFLAQTLELAGYRCAQSADVAEARAYCAVHAVDLVLSDFNMPGATGLELLYSLREAGCGAAFIMATAASQVNLAVDALTHGAADFLVKPLHPAKVVESVQRALANRAQDMALRREHAELERMIRASQADSLRPLAMAVDLRAGDLAGHSLRVGRYAAVLALQCGLGPEDVVHLERAAYLHDIGKLAVPDAILLKPAALTPEETAIMQTHVQKGFDLLRASPQLRPYAELVLTHHERFDGGGYPRRLRGEAVPLPARIFTLADTLDAITSDRPYRAGAAWTVARLEIERQSGSQFDPEVVRAFLAVPEARWPLLRAEVARSVASVA